MRIHSKKSSRHFPPTFNRRLGERAVQSQLRRVTQEVPFTLVNQLAEFLHRSVQMPAAAVEQVEVQGAFQTLTPRRSEILEAILHSYFSDKREAKVVFQNADSELQIDLFRLLALTDFAQNEKTIAHTLRGLGLPQSEMFLLALKAQVKTFIDHVYEKLGQAKNPDWIKKPMIKTQPCGAGEGVRHGGPNPKVDTLLGIPDMLATVTVGRVAMILGFVVPSLSAMLFEVWSTVESANRVPFVIASALLSLAIGAIADAVRKDFLVRRLYTRFFPFFQRMKSGEKRYCQNALEGLVNSFHAAKEEANEMQQHLESLEQAIRHAVVLGRQILFVFSGRIYCGNFFHQSFRKTLLNERQWLIIRRDQALKYMADVRSDLENGKVDREPFSRTCNVQLLRLTEKPYSYTTQAFFPVGVDFRPLRKTQHLNLAGIHHNLSSIYYESRQALARMALLQKKKIRKTTLALVDGYPLALATCPSPIQGHMEGLVGLLESVILKEGEKRKSRDYSDLSLNAAQVWDLAFAKLASELTESTLLSRIQTLIDQKDETGLNCLAERVKGCAEALNELCTAGV